MASIEFFIPLPVDGYAMGPRSADAKASANFIFRISGDMKFSSEETKIGNGVRALLPEQLISILEEFLQDHRNHLLVGADPGTLFINSGGAAMSKNQLTCMVSELTMRYCGKRITPHPFRDVLAFTWLKAHPKDYLTLSKMLWHRSIRTTISVYGGRFNESSGVCAMEAWLNERAAKTT